ncbi:MAG: thermonuclease family protein [Acidobacteria bacterium]|nr:thermonuclease family protein [Acidobacteriota bacterium]
MTDTKRFHPVALFVLLTLAVTLYALAIEPFSGKCVGVQDGDTIEVMRSARAVRVRLDGIDCPEAGQDFGSRAKQFTSSMAFGKQVTVMPKEYDRYGRIVARVLADGKDISFELVKAGLAWHYKQYSSDPELAEAETMARAQQIGIWSMPNPISPRAYRRGERGGRVAAPSASPPQMIAAVFHGNVRSRVLHAPTCRYYDCKNCTAVFTSVEQAIKAGYRVHRECIHNAGVE